MALATKNTFDGERRAALDQARQLLDAHGLLWRHVFHAEPEVPPARHWKHVAQGFLQGRQQHITSGDQSFLLSLVIKAHRLSVKQAAILGELCGLHGVQRWSVAQ
jgi:hypothetical protein